MHHIIWKLKGWWSSKNRDLTWRSDSMLNRLLKRLRSTASPLRSLSIRSRMPSIVLLCTFRSLMIYERNNSNPISLQTKHKSYSSGRWCKAISSKAHTYQIEGSIEFCKTYVRSKNKNILLIIICEKRTLVSKSFLQDTRSQIFTEMSVLQTICLQWSCQHLSIFFRKRTLSRASVED